MKTSPSTDPAWAELHRLHKWIALLLAVVVILTWWAGRRGVMGCASDCADGSASNKPAAVAPVAAPAGAGAAAASTVVAGSMPIGWAWADGKLTLSGQVRDEATRAAIVEAAVKKLGSPGKVIDKLSVSAGAPALPFMARLGDIAGWGSDGRGFLVDRDRIVLSGTVATEGERKQRAEAAALLIGPGFEIDNQIVVKAPGKPTAVSLFFDTGKASLQADAASQLKAIVEYGNALPGSKIQLSGFHDKRGDPKANQELAKNRAKAVRDLLIKAGLAEDRIILVPPVELVGASDDKQARRVEVTIVQ